MKKHLAIFSTQAIERIFAGLKTVEVRFSVKRISPYGEIESGDIVYIKPPGEEIVGQFLVKKVIFMDNLEDKDWDFISKNYSLEAKKINTRFLTIIFIGQVEQFITSPIKFSKRNSKNWVVLT